jgi:hypothetical protein
LEFFSMKKEFKFLYTHILVDIRPWSGSVRKW